MFIPTSAAPKSRHELLNLRRLDAKKPELELVSVDKMFQCDIYLLCRRVIDLLGTIIIS